MCTRLCLVSKPGPIRDATCATIATTPEIKLVILADDALSAIERLKRIKLDLVLIDSNLSKSEVAILLAWLTAHAPNVCKLVARMTSSECDHVVGLGADEAFRRDELADKLELLIHQMPH